MKLVLVGPVPPVRSGIADFVLELLPPLSRRAEVTLLVDGIRPTEEVRESGVAAVRDLSSREGHSALEAADVVLVQLGNDPLHAGAYELLLERSRAGRPVVVELHDVVLGHFAAALWFESGKHDRYLEEARIGHGPAGERIAREEVLGKRLGLWDLDPWRLPMSGRAVCEAAGVVVHSRFARRKVWGMRAEAPVAVIPHAALPPAGFPPKDEARRRSGIAPGELVVTSTGFAVPAKRLDAVVEALAGLRPEIPWSFRVCGEAVAGEVIRRRATELGVAERVVFTGYLPWSRLLEEMAATDLLVNLREPTLGESSGSVARILSAGVPVAVSDVGWYAELPDEAVFKVPTGGAAVAGLRETVERLHADPGLARRVGAAGAELARSQWSLEQVAELYLAALPRLAAGPTPADRFLARIAQASASLGSPGLDPRLAPALARGVELVLGPAGGGEW